MQSASHRITYFQIYRYISSSNTYLNLSRETRFMKKLLKGNKSKRKWYYSNADLGSIKNTNATNKALSMHTVRRMTIRDKLFMKHITDLISMGEISDVLNKDIEVTHVKITADFKYINVYWIPIEEFAPSEKTLQKCANIIRHKLSELRVIGVIPPIQFVRNLQYSIMEQVEEKLKTLTLEQENDPLSCSELSQLFSSDADDQALHEEANLNYHFDVDKSDTALPVMRHDVLGLDHYKIMSRITTSLSKSKKAVQRRMLDINITSADNSSCDISSFRVPNILTKQKQQEMFSEFLRKKRIEEKHRNRAKRVEEQKLLYNYEETEPEYEEDYEEDYKEDYKEDYNSDV